MQRPRSESLRNALVVSVALLVSYAAPRLASSPSEPPAAAPAPSIDLRVFKRSVVSGKDDDDEDRGESQAVKPDADELDEPYVEVAPPRKAPLWLGARPARSQHLRLRSR